MRVKNCGIKILKPLWLAIGKMIIYTFCCWIFQKKIPTFSKKFENFSNAENYYQNRRKSTLFRAFSSALGGMKNCRPSGNSVGRQKFFYFFAEMLRKHLMHSAQIRPSLRMKRALRSGRWDSICCGKCHGGCRVPPTLC